MNKKRVIKFGRKVWSLLTNDEKEEWYNKGTVDFVDTIIQLLHYGHIELTIDEFDEIHDAIMR